MRFHSFSDPSVISPSRLSYELTDRGHLGLNCHDFGSDLLSPHINVNFRLSLIAARDHGGGVFFNETLAGRGD